MGFYSMLTIFTTAKPFLGQTKVNQINALRSWQALAPDVEVILFGSDEGYAEVAEELEIVHVSGVETSEQGTPLVNSMFAMAQAHGHSRVQAYINCDIILLDDFLPAVQRIEMDRFLMVGQRWDLDLNREIDFADEAWRQQLRNQVHQRGSLHPPTGSDYFVYKGDIWGELPALVAGRAGFDNELIYCCRAVRVPVVDATAVAMVVHQNHDYGHHSQGHAGAWYGPEAQVNRKAGHGQAFPFSHINAFSPIDADWRLSPKGFDKNRCRGDWVRYLWGRHVLGDGPAWFRWPGYGLRLARRVRSLVRIALTLLRGCMRGAV